MALIEDPYPGRTYHPGESVNDAKKRQMKAKWDRRRALLAAYKADKGCADCGEHDPVVLDLHHVDRTLKTGVISQRYMKWGVKRLNKELENCEVVCSNCHRRRHAREGYR